MSVLAILGLQTRNQPFLVSLCATLKQKAPSSSTSRKLAELRALREEEKAAKVHRRVWHAAEEVLGAMIDGYDVFLDKRKRLFEFMLQK